MGLLLYWELENTKIHVHFLFLFILIMVYLVMQELLQPRTVNILMNSQHFFTVQIAVEKWRYLKTVQGKYLEVGNYSIYIYFSTCWCQIIFKTTRLLSCKRGLFSYLVQMHQINGYSPLMKALTNSELRKSINYICRTRMEWMSNNFSQRSSPNKR